MGWPVGGGGLLARPPCADRFDPGSAALWLLASKGKFNDKEGSAESDGARDLTDLVGRPIGGCRRKLGAGRFGFGFPSAKLRAAATDNGRQ